jgi:hypothetical protein
VSSKSVAAYLYCPKNKNYDFEQMSEYLIEKLKDTSIEPNSIQEVYADGWEDIPNGLAELVMDANSYSLVILYTLEGIEISDIEMLIDAGCSVYCALAPYAGTVGKTRSDGFKSIKTTLLARAYYRDIRSVNIKVGMKNTIKHVGNVPYGHRRIEDGTLLQIPEKIELANRVASWYREGVAVAEISSRTHFKLSARQIYGLMTHWGITRA